jgi:hypothetical protein
MLPEVPVTPITYVCVGGGGGELVELPPPQAIVTARARPATMSPMWRVRIRSGRAGSSSTPQTSNVVHSSAPKGTRSAGPVRAMIEPLACERAAVFIETTIVLAVVPETVAGFGVMVQVQPAGKPVQVKETSPANPTVGAMLRLKFAVAPAVVVAEVDDPVGGASENSVGLLMMSGMARATATFPAASRAWAVMVCVPLGILVVSKVTVNWSGVVSYEPRLTPSKLN